MVSDGAFKAAYGYDLVKFVLLEDVPDSSVGRASAWEARGPGFESRFGAFFDNHKLNQSNCLILYFNAADSQFHFI